MKTPKHHPMISHVPHPFVLALLFDGELIVLVLRVSPRILLTVASHHFFAETTCWMTSLCHSVVYDVIVSMK
jgi:hypothetical protein